MQTTTAKLYSLEYNNARTYGFSALFIAGNILLPQLCHTIHLRTLNIGRVMSPTLALIVQREAEIDTFKPVPFYTVALELPGLTISGERMVDKAAAEQLKEACQGVAVTIKKVERKEKSEKPPALYDLTTLQRDANRLLGFTAQQTLDYLQSLYEKKRCV